MIQGVVHPSESSSPRSPSGIREPERFALIGVWIILIIGFSIRLPETFPTTANISNMLGSQSVLLVLALGLIIPLRAGDYDLSVANTLGFSAMVVALLNVRHDWNVWLAVGAAILAGVAIGFINGLIVVKFDIDPFIVTLGIGTIVLGLTFFISGSQTISGIDRSLTDVVLSRPIGSIPVSVYYAIGLCVMVWYLFDRTAYGQRLLFVGQSKDVARLNGINVARSRWVALVASGGIAALAGAAHAGTTASADTVSAGAFLLPAFAACFLGSTAIKIGRFNPWGTLIAVYFLVTGITGLQLLGAQQYIQQLFYGSALVISVIASQLVKRRALRRRSRSSP